MEWKIIKPKSPNKIRDIEISIDKFNLGGVKTAKKYGICRQRVAQISRGYVAKLSMQANNIDFKEAHYNPIWYLRADAVNLLFDYYKFLLKTFKE